jgi:hypothetical protein
VYVDTLACELLWQAGKKKEMRKAEAGKGSESIMRSLVAVIVTLSIFMVSAPAMARSGGGERYWERASQYVRTPINAERFDQDLGLPGNKSIRPKKKQGLIENLDPTFKVPNTTQKKEGGTVLR